MKSGYVIFAVFAVLVQDLLVVTAEEQPAEDGNSARSALSGTFKSGTKTIFNRIIFILESTANGTLDAAYSPLLDERAKVIADFKTGVAAIVSLIPNAPSETTQLLDSMMQTFVRHIFDALAESRFEGTNWTIVEPSIKLHDSKALALILAWIDKIFDALENGENFDAVWKDQIDSIRNSAKSVATYYQQKIFHGIMEVTRFTFFPNRVSDDDISNSINTVVAHKNEILLRMDSFYNVIYFAVNVITADD